MAVGEGGRTMMSAGSGHSEGRLGRGIRVDRGIKSSQAPRAYSRERRQKFPRALPEPGRADLNDNRRDERPSPFAFERRVLA